MKKLLFVLTLAVALMAGTASAAFVGGPDNDTTDAVTASVGHIAASPWLDADRAVNGNGLSVDGTEHNDGGWNEDEHWWGDVGAATTAAAGTHDGGNWILFEFDGTYQIADAKIWNLASAGVTNRGMYQVVVEYYNGSSWTQLGGTQIFPEPVVLELNDPEDPESGLHTIPNAGFTLDFGDVFASKVAFTALDDNHGTGNWSVNGRDASASGDMGLSEVRFNITPEPATLSLLAIGAVAMLRRKK